MSTLKHYEKISLSDKHLFNILDGKNNLVIYPKLLDYTDIDEVLGENGMCVLLFEAKKNYGHWCCLWKLDHKTVSFFNPYGGYPDDSLDYIPEHFAKMNNENYPYLSLLLDKSPYVLTYNDIPYQQMDKSIKTCGRHCAIRLLCRNMDDNEYHNYVMHFCNKYEIDPDEFVTLLTMDPEKGF
jgi:hypothetical protein